MIENAEQTNQTATLKYHCTYTLVAEKGVKVTLTKQDDTDFKILKDGNEEQSVTIGTKNSQSPDQVELVIESNASAYANAIITCDYAAATASSGQTTSQCDICFNLTDPGNDSYWSVTGQTSQGDNPSVFSDTAPGTTATVTVAVPTQPNPNTPASPAPVLDPNMVYLLDAAGNSLVFRGNAPLGAKTAQNPQQKIDFPAFVSALDSAFHQTTGHHLPPEGGYEICIIALLSDGEDNILIPEIESFGGTTNQLSENWYPTGNDDAYPIESLTNVTGRMCVWNINPAGQPDGKYVTMASTLAKNINDWIYHGLNESNPYPSKPRIFYIHCASGHDRTGLMCASYLTQKKMLFQQYNNRTSLSQTDLTETFIMGTTLNKLSYSGGQYVPNCYDLNNKAVENPNKSRCFLISGSYNQTFCWVADTLSGESSANFTLADDALSGDPKIAKYASQAAYVETCYPWTNTINSPSLNMDKNTFMQGCKQKESVVS